MTPDGVGVAVQAPSEPGVDELGRAEEPGEARATLATFRALAALFRPYRRTTLVIGLCLLVEAAFNAFLPLSFSFLIDKALIPKDKEALVVILVALAVAVIVAGAVGLGRDRLYANLTARVVADLRLRLFEHLQGLSIGFFQRTQLGDVLSRFSGDLIAVENAFASALAWAVAPGLDVCVYTVILFVLDWRLALVSMLVWPIALLGPRHFAPQAVGASVEKKQLEAATLSVVQENVSGQPVVKAFSLEQPWLESFEERSEKLRRRSGARVVRQLLVERSSLVGVLILDVAVIGIGSWLAFDGSLSIGKLVAFQGLFLALGYSLSYVTQYFPSLVHALGGLRPHRDAPRRAAAGSRCRRRRAAAAPRRRDRLRRRDVRLRAWPGEPARTSPRDIRKGESVAFVGSSGSGKSTVLSLLMRLYDPAGGVVTVDGHDLRGVTQASLRSQLGVVFQESFLFNATVRENIRMAKPTATDAEVVEAARGRRDPRLRRDAAARVRHGRRRARRAALRRAAAADRDRPCRPPGSGRADPRRGDFGTRSRNGDGDQRDARAARAGAHDGRRDAPARRRQERRPDLRARQGRPGGERRPRRAPADGRSLRTALEPAERVHAARRRRAGRGRRRPSLRGAAPRRRRPRAARGGRQALHQRARPGRSRGGAGGRRGRPLLPRRPRPGQRDARGCVGRAGAREHARGRRPFRRGRPAPAGDRGSPR